MSNLESMSMCVRKRGREKVIKAIKKRTLEHVYEIKKERGVGEGRRKRV